MDRIVRRVISPRRRPAPRAWSAMAASAILLVDAVGQNKHDVHSFFSGLRQPLGSVNRKLTEEDESQIRLRIQSRLEEVCLAAGSGEATEFAKKFLSILNDFVLP